MNSELCLSLLVRLKHKKRLPHDNLGDLLRCFDDIFSSLWMFEENLGRRGRGGPGIPSRVLAPLAHFRGDQREQKK
jgi:hypothetical protein